MKHLQAGALVAAFVVLAFLIAALVYQLLSTIIGPLLTLTAITLAVIIFIGASLIDWYTEKRSS